jgi:hypothetical protein
MLRIEERMNLRSLLTGATLAASCLVAALGPGCGGSSSEPGFGGDGPGGASGSGGSSSGGGGGSGGSSSGSAPIFGLDGSIADTGSGGCVGLQCQQQSCPGGGSTTITGHVYDPAGNNPLYKVVVYVPGSDPTPITDGIGAGSCSCDALYSGSPIAAAITDPAGSFTLTNAPVGANIPLVVQIGKWRNYFVIPNVTACTTNNADTLLPAKLTLPKTQTETKFSNIPNIAVSTGGADTMECILARIGVAESEYTGDPTSTTGHIHIFQGAGGNDTVNPQGPSSPQSLWDTDADINRYDVVMLSCEGSETTDPNSQVLADYVNGGGRVFASHYHYAFFFNDETNTNATQFPNVANWSLAYNAATGGGLLGGSDSYNEAVAAIIQTTLASGAAFPEGQALKTWLNGVGALTGPPTGELGIPDGAGRYDGVVGPTNVSTVWAATDPNTISQGESVSSQYFSFDMPFNAPLNDAGVPGYCGRVVYSDLHVGAASNDYQNSETVPTGCSYPQALSADEDAIEFILFDLSSCVTPVTSIPQPPPVQPPPK